MCINLRDGNSLYYDCNTAHIPIALNAAQRAQGPGSTALALGLSLGFFLFHI